MSERYESLAKVAASGLLAVKAFVREHGELSIEERGWISTFGVENGDRALVEYGIRTGGEPAEPLEEAMRIGNVDGLHRVFDTYSTRVAHEALLSGINTNNLSVADWGLARGASFEMAISHVMALDEESPDTMNIIDWLYEGHNNLSMAEVNAAVRRVAASPACKPKNIAYLRELMHGGN